ncbi:probable ATP-dependent RNA helicase DHX34 isoform X2 [Sabethes cyaneus]|uniref:probable ATP-dependent RNA helicase DHX34 isoform X2 n=1 Tax=Sabethes cyaneus TaxID=53552 RepID=UPI00237D559B|nr:probable ATP-dependent RNA helicase DHX34 isoform X2 [Sabethes cyaneus]
MSYPRHRKSDKYDRDWDRKESTKSQGYEKDRDDRRNEEDWDWEESTTSRGHEKDSDGKGFAEDRKRRAEWSRSVEFGFRKRKFRDGSESPEKSHSQKSDTEEGDNRRNGREWDCEEPTTSRGHAKDHDDRRNERDWGQQEPTTISLGKGFVEDRKRRAEWSSSLECGFRRRKYRDCPESPEKSNPQKKDRDDNRNERDWDWERPTTSRGHEKDRDDRRNEQDWDWDKSRTSRGHEKDRDDERNNRDWNRQEPTAKGKGFTENRKTRVESSSSLEFGFRESPEKSNSQKSEIEETNLINFSFLNHKSELNRVLLGYCSRDQLVKDHNDFWLFLNKYEALLKRSGQCILPQPLDESELRNDEMMQSQYNKAYTLPMTFSIPFEELYSRLPQSEKGRIISPFKLKQFLQIVLHYLDFRQKERFDKLRKLRNAQANLPVAKYRDEIVSAVQNEKVVILAGDTGCGKSTQVPQYLHHAGFKKIACTQPRRIACISLSKRVAHEMLCEYGTEVGYQIRFERTKSTHTNILFITEGLLLRQLAAEETLSQYSVIILDEIHERHLHGDFLLGITKCLIRARPDVKLVLMSATINIKLFGDYFADENVHIIEVPGRLFPIKLHYMPQVQDIAVSAGTNKTKQKTSNRISPDPYLQILQMIDQKYPPSEKGDVLIFLSGLNEITTIVDAAKEYAEKAKNWIILPLHSTLSIAEQDKVFDYAPEGMRKCIISTNIAETSVTIDGIRFVVDSGKVKEMSYDPTTKMQRLKEFWISKASAEQRKGRAGRTGPGICYRLYSEKQFYDFDPFTTAEILKVPLESLLLQMISMGLPDARLFPFVEPPLAASIENAITNLKQHEALTANEKLTPLGIALAKIPVDIGIGKMLLMGCVFQQLQPVLTLAAALSVQTPFTNRAFRDAECERALRTLESDHGDPITLLNAYKEWLELKQSSNHYRRDEERQNTKSWCRRRGLEEQRFYEITKLRNQFQELLQDCGLMENSSGSENMTSAERAIRHGEMKQLRQLRKAHRMEAPRRRQLLKSDPWGLGDDEEDDGKIDIRDVEFRMKLDSSKLQNLVSGATACNYRDLMTLKLILVSGLYPQVAIADDYNYCKGPSEQFFHTQTKPYATLHPMGFFANNVQVLQLTENDIIEKTGLYKSRQPLSSSHQILCYLTLLETNKTYLMNTLRMPAAQTLLLFGHTVDTNLTFSRLICDSWLCLDFPSPETGQVLLYKASKLKRLWNQLLVEKLKVLTVTADEELTKSQREKSIEQMNSELWHDLAQFMNTEVCYTIKRLLPADVKTMYKGPAVTEPVDLDPNPFAEDFVPIQNDVKGGMHITENIIYGCVTETEWSMQMYDDIISNDWECTECTCTYNLTGLQKLQHQIVCKPKPTIETKSQPQEPATSGKLKPNSKKYDCPKCETTLYLTVLEILRHKKTCSRTVEPGVDCPSANIEPG